MAIAGVPVLTQVSPVPPIASLLDRRLGPRAKFRVLSLRFWRLALPAVMPRAKLNPARVINNLLHHAIRRTSARVNAVVEPGLCWAAVGGAGPSPEAGIAPSLDPYAHGTRLELVWEDSDKLPAEG